MRVVDFRSMMFALAGAERYRRKRLPYRRKRLLGLICPAFPTGQGMLRQLYIHHTKKR
ncbi:hypothetical protein [Fictibacillus enclensis]|uniref:hypothetical protein n=1 Tax=Fictibacillus enclensis TaxID=1017270 RepID=UPI0012E38D84|nr:hypothetical protein [Fictibacillus enclensis]